MVTTLLIALAISLALNIIFFSLAYRLKTDKFTDITYSLTFIAIALFSLSQSSHNNIETIGVILVIIWGLRLGGFLLYRVIKKGKDKRFDGVREDFGRFAKFWVNQGLVAWVLMIPLVLAASKHSHFSYLSVLGIIIWGFGLVIESAADFQKYAFRLTPSNRNKWISSGVWKYSRHPNYFGEMLIWAGLYVYVLQSLSLVSKIIGLISPVAIIVLLRYGSGVPILEKEADKKWGKDPDYVSYKKKTNLLIPFLNN